MSAKIIRFPGFLLVGRNTIQKDCKIYPDMAALMADLSKEDRERSHRWLMKKNNGKSSYRAGVLSGALPPASSRLA